MLPGSHTYINSLIINIPHHSAITFATIDEPTLKTHRPEVRVYVRVHSWCCNFYESGHTYTEMNPPL